MAIIRQYYRQSRLSTGTSTEWTDENPVLRKGEIGYETNTRKLKVGDGATAWNTLSYVTAIAAGGSIAVEDDTVSVDPSATTLDFGTGLDVTNDGGGHLTIDSTSSGVTDHGALTGLADDDHPQYATNTEFDDHSARHENGGADEISIAGLDGTSAELSNHLADAVDAHDASAISFVPNGSIASTDVQAAIQEVRDEAAGGGAPSTADYLVGTADGGLSNEIVVGTTPGGELGGTWASPTVDATHSGSTHAAATDTHIADAVDAHDASAISADSTTLVGVGTDVQAVLEELDNGIADHLADAADAHDASAVSVLDTAAQITATDVEGALAEIVDASQAHEAAADPHTGYRLESADHSHASTGLQAGTLDHGTALTGLSDDDHPQYMLESLLDAKGDLISASADNTPAKVTAGANDTILMADSGQAAGLKWVASQTPSTQASADAAAEGTADTFSRGDHKHGMPTFPLKTDFDAVIFTVGGVILTPTTGQTIIAWRAPFACTVTQVRGQVDTGTTTVINAGKGFVGGTTEFCSADITIDPADAWETGVVDQNTSIAAGDAVYLEVVTAGTATQVTIQVELTRDLSP